MKQILCDWPQAPCGIQPFDLSSLRLVATFINWKGKYSEMYQTNKLYILVDAKNMFDYCSTPRMESLNPASQLNTVLPPQEPKYIKYKELI